jgi:hypothetical protein
LFVLFFDFGRPVQHCRDGGAIAGLCGQGQQEPLPIMMTFK